MWVMVKSTDAGSMATRHYPRVSPAARSVHLRWDAPRGDAFKNELVVERSQRGTYFCACGFSVGYFGVQELVDRRRVALFSVWDQALGPVAIVDSADGVRTGRFGGEGTGAQAFRDVEWEEGIAITFLVTTAEDETSTSYSAHLSVGGPQLAMATYRVPTRGTLLTGYYSFIEDFRRDRRSPTEVRSARFGPARVRANRRWSTSTEARFTADDNPLKSIDAAVVGDTIRLETGGDTVNRTPLDSLLRPG